MEYIERKELDNWIERICDDMEVDAEYMLSRVDEIPVANVAPVRDGNWINAVYKKQYFKRCTECGTYIEETFFAYDYEVKFCPQCGAKMGAD